MRFRLTATLLAALATTADAQVAQRRPPVIDLHVHSTNAVSPQRQAGVMQELNIRFIWLAALAPDLPAWSQALPEGKFLPAITLPCKGGRAPFVPRPCWTGTADFPDTAWLRTEVKAGRIRGLGEMVPQLFGVSPADERLEPYWSLAEEHDLPVALHMGPGPAAAAYESSRSPVKFPEFRMAMNDPMVLEEMLLRHKRLRIVLMHAGWPFLEQTIALMYAHPNVYLDLGALHSPMVMPRPAFQHHLRRLVEAGFGRRIVYGSDFPNTVATGIDAISTADFLSEEQKADILCGNAARFLRLPPETCAP